METTLYGAERNGGGFIKEVRDAAIATKEAIEQTRDNESAIEAKLTVLMDRRGGLREIAKVSLPPLLVGAASVIAVLLTR